jgi:predicted RNA-binding Zn-ribbon protein involved in translation (DUF1610 family)
MAEAERVCVRCKSVLRETPTEELECPRCGRVGVWNVTVNHKVVAAGRRALRGGIAIWLSWRLEDLLSSSDHELAPSRSGWSEWS